MKATSSEMGKQLAERKQGINKPKRRNKEEKLKKKVKKEANHEKKEKHRKKKRHTSDSESGSDSESYSDFAKYPSPRMKVIVRRNIETVPRMKTLEVEGAMDDGSQPSGPVSKEFASDSDQASVCRSSMSRLSSDAESFSRSVRRRSMMVETSDIDGPEVPIPSLIIENAETSQRSNE